VFLGTPHRGSSKAGLGELAANIAKLAFQRPNIQLVQLLKKDSALLESQRRSFASISRDMAIGSIYETVPTRAAGLVSAQTLRHHRNTLMLRQIVPEASATMGIFGEVVDSVSANHMEMCKFATKDDDGYPIVSDVIISFAAKAIKATTQGTRSQSATGGSEQQAPAPLLLTSGTVEPNPAWNSSEARAESYVTIEVEEA